MITRVVFRGRVDGPSMSFEELTTEEHRQAFPMADIAQVLELSAIGVHIVKDGYDFNVPWSSIRFTMGPESNARAERSEAFTGGDGYASAAIRSAAANEIDLRDTIARLDVEMKRVGLKAQDDLNEELHRDHSAPTPEIALITKPPHACPVCGIPNERARTSFLCDPHSTPENRALFKKQAPAKGNR